MEPRPPQPPFCVHDTGSTQYWIWPFLIGDWRYRVVNKEKRGTRYAYDVHIWTDRGWVFVVQVDASSPEEGGFAAALEVANTMPSDDPERKTCQGRVGRSEAGRAGQRAWRCQAFGAWHRTTYARSRMPFELWLCLDPGTQFSGDQSGCSLQAVPLSVLGCGHAVPAVGV